MSGRARRRQRRSAAPERDTIYANLGVDESFGGSGNDRL